jgi:hypothetical protein
MDCHVPLCHRFARLPDPVAALDALRHAVDGFPAFTVRTTEPAVISRGDRADVVLPLEDTPHLARLHERVVVALTPWTEPAGEEYRPQIAVVEAIPAEGVESTLGVIAGWRLNYAWVVRDLDLVGLQGSVLWRSLGRLDFGRP